MAESRSKEEQIEISLRQHLEQEKAHEISLSDIVTTEEYRNLCGGQYKCGQEDLEKLLFTFGMDVNKGYETQYLKHRNWSGSVVECPRYVGYKRTDKEWLNFIRKNTNKYQNS